MVVDWVDAWFRSRTVTVRMRIAGVRVDGRCISL